MSDRLSSFRRWMVVLVIAALASWYVVSTNIKKAIDYPLWNNTMFMVGRLSENLTPEYVASKMGKSGPPQETTILRTDWQYDEKMIEAIDMKRSKATPNKDGWGSLFYIICDFNNDGKVPNPELLTVPPKPGATQKELSTSIAIFSAGPDGDPATWEDNMPPRMTR